MKIVNNFFYYYKFIVLILPVFLVFSQFYFIIIDVFGTEIETKSKSIEFSFDWMSILLKSSITFLLGGIITEMRYTKLGIC